MTVLKTTVIGATLLVLMGAKGEGCMPSDFSVDITHHDSGDLMNDEVGAEECPPGSYAEWVCEAPLEPPSFDAPGTEEGPAFEEPAKAGPQAGEPGEEGPEQGDAESIAPLPGEFDDEAAILGSDDGCEMICVSDLGEQLACPEGTVEQVVCADDLGSPEEDGELTAPIEGEPTAPIEGEPTAPVVPADNCRAECVPVEACPHEEGASHEPLTT